MLSGLQAAPLSKGAGIEILSGQRNRLINGDFNVNQLGVSGAVTLAAGAYGHDQWKAGAAGCTYTYSTVGGLTTLTITAGSLIQPIEGVNVEGGTYVVSRVGTAPGRVVGGSYGATPFLITGVVGGATLSVEFGVGTLASVRVEPGLIVTPPERRLLGIELALCKRYYQVLQCGYQGQVVSGTGYGGTVNFPVEMRATPTLSFVSDIQISNFQTGTLALTNARAQACDAAKIASGTGAGTFAALFSATSRIP